MNRDRLSIEELRTELERLQLAAQNIERLIHQAEERGQEQEQEQVQANPAGAGGRQGDVILDIDINRRADINYTENHPVVYDWSDNEILIGDTV